MNKKLSEIDIDFELYQKVNYEKLKKNSVILLHSDKEFLFVASYEKLNNDIFLYLESIFLKPIKTTVLPKGDIDSKFIEIDKSINILMIQKQIIDSLNKTVTRDEDDTPIISLIELLIKYAIESNSSDIHIESQKDKIVIRYRIDGILKTLFEFNKRIYSALLTRLKLLASLDISNSKKPLNGGFSIDINGKSIDCRISIMPTIFGNSIVLRVLNNKNALLNINSLGFDEIELRKIKNILNHSNGMILVTGPTGSGKSTTLYAMINYLNNSNKKIITIEDPVEYKIDSLSQIQINEKVNFTFYDALKNVLRQDPDILMVGEIRDSESLNIAVKASLTGHLLLSTLHTNSAISTITRLRDMGLAEYLISNTLRAIISQRLVRKLCEFCKEPIKVSHLDKKVQENFDDRNSTIFKACGCNFCFNSGYSGRVAVLEILIAEDDNIKNILKLIDEGKEHQIYKELNIPTIKELAIKSVTNGVTSIDEILRVLD
jgi:type II secretory ATPase GspE/PulE/Tfp pilus assembly ATPase PilB-like protein